MRKNKKKVTAFSSKTMHLDVLFVLLPVEKVCQN